MNSELERFVLERVAHLRRAFLSYDRGVVVGTVLAFIPVFPACFFGMLLSFINLGFALNNRLNRRNRNAAILGACVGAFFTVLWWYAFGPLSDVHIAALMTSILNSVFEFIWGVLGGASLRRDEFV
jgi:Na+/proline symporter